MLGAPASSAPPREAARGQMLEQVGSAWTAGGTVPRPETTSRGESPDALTQRLATLVLPEVSFANAPLSAVVEALNATAREMAAAQRVSDAINIVLVDPFAEAGDVNISLRNVSLRRVLELVAESAGFATAIEADAVVLRAANAAPALMTGYFPVQRSAVGQILAAAGAGPSDLPPFAGGDGPTLRQFLQLSGVDFASIPGSGLAYDGAGLLVTQTRANLDRVARILGRYAAVRQVEIEARFMEVQEGVLEEIGVAWSLARRGLTQLDPLTGLPIRDRTGRPVLIPQETYETAGVNRTLAEAFNGAQSLNSILIDGEAAASTQPSRLPGTAQLGTTASSLARVAGWIGDIDVNAVVRALAQKQGTDLLSAPRLTVLSGQPASITVAQEMRYPQSYGQIQSQVGSTGSGGSGNGGSAGVTITAGTPQDFATRNVGVELRVTAHVEDDGGSISLELNPKVTDFDGFMEYGGPSLAISAGTSVTVPPGFYQPIFSVREVSTRVTVWDGATIVMGGLTREDVKRVDDHVPWLGRIPLLGRLFRSKGESTQKRSLLIFVTARLVTPGGGPVRPPGDG